MMRQFVVVVVIALSTLLGICCAQNTTSLDQLINDIFKTQEGISTFSPPPTSFNPTPTKTTVLGPTLNDNSPPPATDKYKSCGNQMECVPRFLCKNDTITNSGIGVIDIRIDGVTCEYLEECCSIPDQTTTPIIDPVPPEQHEGCGFQNPDGVGFKIIGDQSNESQFGEFPWMAAILREEQTAGETLNLYECGGALIAPNTILTAAHCVQTRVAETLVVRAGEWDTQTKTEILPHQDRRVKEIIVHEKYNKGALFNDIALLILETPFVWQENVRPVCLPESHANFDYSRCFATGWGKDKFDRSGIYQVILKKIDLPIVPRDQCQANLRKTRLGKYFQLNESFICAGGEKDKDTCKGDGGSPLVCPVPGVKNRFYQAGIVAWGVGCGEVDIPGVYANVPYLRQWINEKLSQRGVDFRHFTP